MADMMTMASPAAPAAPKKKAKKRKAKKDDFFEKLAELRERAGPENLDDGTMFKREPIR